MFFHLTGRSVAPAAAPMASRLQAWAPSMIGVAVADHHGLIPRCSIKTGILSKQYRIT